LGNPYGLTDWTPQTVIFTLDKELEYDRTKVPQFTYFCHGFNHDPNKENIIDIEIKDLNLSVMNVLSSDDYNGYSLTLKASEGEYFTESLSGVKTITPTFRIKGKVTSITESTCQMYWFKEDLQVQIGEEGFNAYGGLGWRLLNPGDPSQFTLKVNKDDFISEKKYKCVLIYKEIQISSIITLKNLTNVNFVELTSATGTNQYVKNIGKVRLRVTTRSEGVTNTEDNIERISYQWLIFNQEFQPVTEYLDSIKQTENTRLTEDNEFVAEFSYPVSYINNLNEFVCSVYYKNTEDELIELGSDSLIISTIDPSEDEDKEGMFLSIIDGDRLYKYDVNGNSPLSPSYLGPTSSMINAVPALSFRLIKENGIELSESEYEQVSATWTIPKDSMFTYSDNSAFDAESNSYIVHKTGNVPLAYGIAKRFDFKKMGSTIKLKVDFLGTVTTAFTNITFTKEGQLGTNGTAYSAQIVWGGNGAEDSLPYGQIKDGKEQKLKFLYNTADGTLSYYKDTGYIQWGEDGVNPLFVKVWEDDEELKAGYTVNFSMFDEKNTNPCFTIDNDGKISRVLDKNDNVIPIEIDKIYVNIVQAEITLDSETLAGTPQKVYCYYPIELTIVNSSDTPKPAIREGYSEVMYAADGTNPQYDSSRPFVATLDEVDVSSGEVTWSVSPHFTYQTKDGADVAPAFAPKPKNKYDDGITLNYVKISTDNAVHINPIIFYYNRYGMNNFNAWDGNKVEVNDGYLLAPQMGAGVKEEDNSFTGVVMGQKNILDSTVDPPAANAQLGLFGYNKGNQTFKLSSNNGSAIFGTSNGGQIIIDPTQDRALLYSSNLFNSDKKWLDANTGLPTQSAYEDINELLSTGKVSNNDNIQNAGMVIDLTTPGIAFGSGKFRVDAEGNLYAGGTEGIEINGKENYIRFDSENGKIFSGGHNELNSKKDGFFLNNNGFSIGKNFYVTVDGVVKVGPRNTDSDNPDIIDRNCWVINGSEYRIIYDGAGEPIIKNTILKYIPVGAKPLLIPQNAIKVIDATTGNYVYTNRGGYLYETDENGNVLCDRRQADGTIVHGGVGEIIYETDENGSFKYERNEYDEIIFEHDEDNNIYCTRLAVTFDGSYERKEDTTEGDILYSSIQMVGSRGQNLYERNENGNIIWIIPEKMSYIRDSNNLPINDSLDRGILNYEDNPNAYGEYTEEDLENKDIYEIEEMPNSYIGQGINKFHYATYAWKDPDMDGWSETVPSVNPSNSAYIGTDGICLGKNFSVDYKGNLIAGYGRFNSLYLDGYRSETFKVITGISFMPTIQTSVDGKSILSLTLSYDSKDIIACVRRNLENVAIGATLPLPEINDPGAGTGYGINGGTICELVTYEVETFDIPQVEVPIP